MVLLVALVGFMGLTAGSVSAQGEGCAYGDDAFVLNLVDPTKDGVITIADLRTIADGLSAESPFKAQLDGLIDDAEAQGVTGIRYDSTGACAPVTTTPVTTTPVTTTPVTTTPVTTTTATATDPATTAPDDDGDDDGVNELPDTGRGPDSDQGNTTLVMLLGGMSLFIAAAFLWTQRRAS